MGHGNRGLIGRVAAVIGGAALAVSVFLTWYSLSLADLLRAAAGQVPGHFSGALSAPLPAGNDLLLAWSGWRAVHAIRFVLLMVGVAALASSARSHQTPGSQPALLVLAGGLVAGALVASRIETPPSALDISLGPFDVTSPASAGAMLSQLLRVHAGAWIALAGSALIALGGGLQLPERGRVRSPGAPSKADMATWSW